MVRIYLVLAVIAVSLLASNLVIGFMTGDVRGELREVLAATRELNNAKRRGDLSTEHEAAAKLQEAQTSFKPFQRWLSFHILLGVLSSLVVVLVNSICITYFIGTARWCREVVETYDLQASLIHRSDALKRKTFPWAVFGILLILAVIALGGMADPTSRFGSSSHWVTIHYIVAIFSTAFIAWSFLVQVGNIGANYEVISEILAEVRRIRAARGLDQEENETAAEAEAS